MKEYWNGRVCCFAQPFGKVLWLCFRVSALKLAYKNELSSLKEHHSKETEQFKREMSRLQRQVDKLQG